MDERGFFDGIKIFKDWFVGCLMRECRACHKKIGLFDGYESRVKRYCPECLRKKKKLKSKKEKTSLSFWKTILVIVAFILIIYFLENNSGNGDYKYCVDSCVSENDFCLESYTDYTSNFIEYILYDDMKQCQMDLEDCVDDC